MDEQIKEDEKEDLSSLTHLNVAALFAPGATVLDKYLVINLLGEGGMGSVYRVKDLQQRSEYALKYLNKHHTNDVIWRRFDNEVRAANKLDHPNLIKVHDSGLLPDGQPYFIMDLVDGITLAEELKLKGRLRLEEVLKILIQVGFALAYAHDKGVIHRDIKPSNIMIVTAPQGTGGAVKLVDFGIAKLTGKDEFNQLTLTRTGEIFGSPLYMSPEQCAGTGADHRSDLYSFGCVMYEALTGAPPFLADNALSTMLKHQSERPLSLREASLGSEFPEAIEAIVAKLLEKDPAQRYQDVHQLSRDLINVERKLLADTGQSLAPHPNSGALLAKGTAFNRSFSLRAPWAILIISIVFLSGLAIGLAVNRGVDPAVKPSDLSSSHDIYKTYRFPGAPAPDLKPFSVISNDGKTRDFHFPPDSMGPMQMQGVPGEITAAGSILLDNFAPLSLDASAFSFEHPELFTRFRPDEVWELKLVGCDKNLDVILNNLRHWQKLRSLNLTGSNANDDSLTFIGRLPHLTTLLLTGSEVSGAGLADLKILPTLVELECESLVNVKPLLNRLGTMQNLRFLNLSKVHFDASDFMKISRLEHLSRLDLTNTALNDQTIRILGAMTKLTQIHVQKCPLTPASIETFKKMHSLIFIRISYDGWSKADQLRLQSAVGEKCVIGWVPTSFNDLQIEDLQKMPSTKF